MEQSRTENSQLQVENEKLSNNVEDLRELNEQFRSRIEELHTKNPDPLRSRSVGEFDKLYNIIGARANQEDGGWDMKAVSAALIRNAEEKEYLRTKITNLRVENQQLTTKNLELCENNERLVLKPQSSTSMRRLSKLSEIEEIRKKNKQSDIVTAEALD
ncbi:MAG: hypothetical protein Q9165_001048 [Trypethelium subeluteriae]